ncbi:MAG: response regulator transcription factor [Clostridia bacterium]|nr:response regulator transcription factor [Clostridia bacterium]
MSLIRILIADDQTLMRDGLKTIFDLEDDMEVVGVAENGKQAYGMVGELHPDIVLMDIRMPIVNGVESTMMIKKDYPETVVVMLTTFDDEEYIVKALSYGASGYLLKDIQGNKLIQAVRDAVTGNMLMPSNIAIKLAARACHMPQETSHDFQSGKQEFSERELEIVKLMVDGCSNREIATKLFISEGTAKNYISVIYSKIGVSDRSKAVALLRDYV